MAKSIGVTPHFSPNFFPQNDSEWLEMDFKHNFSKCHVFTHEKEDTNKKVQKALKCTHVVRSKSIFFEFPQRADYEKRDLPCVYYKILCSFN